MLKETGDQQEKLLAAFEKETREKALLDITNAVWISSISFSLFIVLDYFVYPRLFLLFLVLRIGVVAANAIVFLVLRTSFAPRHPRAIAMVQYLVYGIAVIVMIHFAEGYASPYYAGLNVILLSTYSSCL